MPLLGGIRPPIALLCVLILALAGLTAKVLGPGAEPVVPKAVLSSQQYFAQDGAIALRASIDERVTDLERTATALNAGSTTDPERVLSDLSKAYQKWTGTTVLDLGTGKVLAARGERIPLAWVDKDVLTGDKALTPRMVRLETGDVRLMTMAVLEGKEGRSSCWSPPTASPCRPSTWARSAAWPSSRGAARSSPPPASSSPRRSTRTRNARNSPSCRSR